MSKYRTDKELTDNLKLDINTEESLQELINRHSGIFLDIVTSYVPRTSTSGCREDLINDLEYYIYNAGLKYDHTKNTKFSTFLGNEAKWACLNQCLCLMILNSVSFYLNPFQCANTPF